MHDMIEVVRTFPTGARLVRRVSYVWPCFNKCGALVSVDRQTFVMLESKQLLGIPCKNCLTPPASGMSAAA